MATHSSFPAWILDRGPWWATVCGAAESHTTERLSTWGSWTGHPDQRAPRHALARRGRRLSLCVGLPPQGRSPNFWK